MGPIKKISLLLVVALTAFRLFAQTPGDKLVWDVITFEEPFPYEYLEINQPPVISSVNVWQIGVPNKVFFDSAYSPNNAIVTDTLNSYPVNNYSRFDLKIGNFNNDWYGHSVLFEIKHKFDTDTLKDGGFITVSYDEGLTWANIIKDSFGYFDVRPWGEEAFYDTVNVNIYSEDDTLFNGEYGFSGKSDGWVTTKFGWYIEPSKTDYLGDTMIVSFNFISDSIETNKEGWMIDNIMLYSIDLGGGIDDVKPMEFTVSPNPMGEEAFIELNDYHEIELSIFDIQGRMVRQKRYQNNRTITLLKEELSPGIYFVKIRSSKNLVGIKKLIIR